MMNSVLLTINLSLLAFVLKYHQLTTTADDIIPWTNARNVLQRACPTQEMCDIKPQRIGLASCCNGCSCRADCADQKICCFLNTSVYDDSETCLYPRSKFHNVYIHTTMKSFTAAYYIVAKPPAGGCINEDKNACNSSQPSLSAPVYSSVTEKLYFNTDCAACHGVTEELREWESVLICHSLDTRTKIDFEEEVTKFLADPSSTSSRCFLFYYGNGLFKGVRRCLMYTSQPIESLFKGTIDDWDDSLFNMTFNDVAAACMSGFDAPVFSMAMERWYPNPFCRIYEERKLIENCVTNLDVQQEYMTLLNPLAKDALRSGKRVENSEDLVCIRDGQIDPKICRPVLCPLGHIKDRNANCFFIGKNVIYRGTHVSTAYLLLQRGHDPGNDSQPLQNIHIANLTLDINLSPLLNIVAVGVPAVPDDAREGSRGHSTKTRDELLLRVEMIGDITKVLEALKEQLKKSVVVTFSQVPLNRTYNQSLYPVTLDIVEELMTYMPNQSTVYCTRKAVGGLSGHQNFSVCWKFLSGIHTLKKKHFVINKLYLYDLLELTPGEFTLMENDTLLYYERRDMYLYDKEFVVIEDENGNKTARICIKDSGFEPLVDGCDGNVSSQMAIIVSLVVTVWNVVSLTV